MLEPIGSNVILEIITRGDEFAEGVKKRSGIFIEGSSIKQDEPDRGRVYAISPHIEKPPYKVGEVVFFHTKEVFQGFRWDDKDLVSVKHPEILGKLEL